jgi:hypothetical protein
MSDFESEDLVRYAFGQAPADLCARIEAAAAQDEELAAKLACVRALASTPEPEELTGRRRALPLRISRRRALIAASGLLGTFGLSWAAYAYFHERPLLADDFSDGWLDARLWRGERRIIREEKGYLMLMNRGILVTREQFPPPIDISFDWQWINLAGDPNYSDDLAVALRTSGRAMDVRPYDVTDGIIIRFHASPGRVSAVLAKPQPPHGGLGELPDGSLPMPAEAWHHIRITDDGDRIAVYFTGPAVPRQSKQEPVMAVRCSNTFPRYFVAVYNREHIAESPQESRIDNVVIRRLR